MESAPDSSELLSRAATCRRIAETIGSETLAETLVEIAEAYEAQAAEQA
jgi:hypothetical protein